MALQDALDLLDKIAEYQSVISAYQTKIDMAVAEARSHLAPGESRPAGSVSPIKSLKVWTDWLAENKPALRQTIWDATGINLSTAGHDLTREWKAQMAFLPDDSFLDDTVFRIQNFSQGKGRPAMIYFLWSQRFDVYPLFGVGPSQRPVPVVSQPSEPTFGEWSLDGQGALDV